MTTTRWSIRTNGRLLLALLSALVMGAMIFAACGGDDEEQEQPAAAAAPAEQQQQQEQPAAQPEQEQQQSAPAEEEVIWIDIGVVAPSSGGYEVFGHTYEASGKLVEHEINTGAQYCIDQGVCEEGGGFLIDGKLHKIRIHFRDDRSDINAHVALVQELVRDVGIVACMCGTPHDFAIASSKVTQPAKVLHFSGSSTLEEILTEEATAPGGENRYLFQTETREWQRSGSVMKGAVDLIDPDSKVSVILMLNDATGQFLGPYFKRALEANGQTVPDIIYWDPETTDFSPLFSRAKGHDPDIVLFLYDPDRAIQAIPQALEIGAAKSGYFMFGIDPGEYKKRELQSDLPVGMACVPICWGATDRQQAAEYWVRYEEFGNELRSFSSVSLLTYDDYYMLIKAYQAAGTFTDPDAVVDALLEVRHDGVIADGFYFDSRHIVAHGTEVCVSRNLEFECQFTPPPAEPPPGTPGF